VVVEPVDLERFDAFIGGFSRRDPAEIMNVRCSWQRRANVEPQKRNTVISQISDRHRNGISAGGMGGLC
jgi:hypothetical protein